MNAVALEIRGEDGIRIGDFIDRARTRLLHTRDHTRVSIAVTTAAGHSDRVLRPLAGVSVAARVV